MHSRKPVYRRKIPWYEYMHSFSRASKEVSTPLFTEFQSIGTAIGRLCYARQKLINFDAEVNFVSERVKNNAKSTAFLQTANGYLDTLGTWKRALKYYTKSIIYAIPGTPELGIAYAGRSAILYELGRYEDCLTDIGRALTYNCPNNVKGVLFCRKMRCLRLLRRPRWEIQDTVDSALHALSLMPPGIEGREEVQNTMDDKFFLIPKDLVKRRRGWKPPYKITKMKPVMNDPFCPIVGGTDLLTRHTDALGRHVITTNNLRPGRLIAVLPSYVRAVGPHKSYRMCSECLKRTRIGIHCHKCPNVVYCSEKCRDKAWDDYHEMECPVLGVLLDCNMSTPALTAMRMTLRGLREAGSIERLIKLSGAINSCPEPHKLGFTGERFDTTKYASVYAMNPRAMRQSHSEKFYISTTALMIVYYLATMSNILGRRYRDSIKVFTWNPRLVYLAELVVENMNIVLRAALRTTRCSIRIRDDIALSCLTSLFKHSCNPNIAVFGRYKNVLMSIRPIRAGQQICINYHNLHFTKDDWVKRQVLLLKKYRFRCQCPPCRYYWPTKTRLPSIAGDATDFLEDAVANRYFVKSLEYRLYMKKKLDLDRPQPFLGLEHIRGILEGLSETGTPYQELFAYESILKRMIAEGIVCD
ncbi:SET and MYND domain-containing protein 4-like [Diachasmimorpha longicaudata]|uniref:SET and MYND domain-containing protein 4-like n=1 Tax=Diachasmimorpha longicaudata TaxID=58733 RepID=UPI0030B8C2D6